MTCHRCGREITNPASIKRGAGRTCHAKEIEARDDARQISFEFMMGQEYKKQGEEIIKMRGFIYRLGTTIKDLGERTRAAWLIRIGLKIRGSV